MKNVVDRCRFCRNEIPSGASKCSHCREWLVDKTREDQVPDQTDLRRLPEVAVLAPASFQSRLAAFFPRVNYWIFYLACSIAAYAAIAFYWMTSGEELVFLVSFFLNAMQMFFSSAGIVWFEKLLDRFRSEIPAITGWSHEKSEEYYLQARQRIFAPGLPVLTGFLVCTAAVTGDNWIIGVPFVSNAGAIAYSIYEFCFLFWSASAIVYFIMFAMFIRELGDNELRILIIQEDNSGIRLLGKFILQTTLFAVIPYVCSITARHIGGWNFGSLLVVWFALFGISILFYLFWPIYNIHRAMVREKDRKLNLVSLELNRLLAHAQLERENIQKIRNLLEIRAHLHEINTWPFDMNKVVGLLSALVIPLASILIDRAMQK
jgi:hypothetical protein